MASVNWTIIGSDNGLSLNLHQVNVWINVDILSIGPFGTDFGEIWIEIQQFSFKWTIPLLGPFWLNVLTHWGRDKMDAISQTTFSRAFSSMKIAVFWLNFHWNMFARFNWQQSSIVSDNGLAPIRRQAIIWNNDDKFTDAYMRHSASMS